MTGKTRRDPIHDQRQLMRLVPNLQIAKIFHKLTADNRYAKERPTTFPDFIGGKTRSGNEASPETKLLCRDLLQLDAVAEVA